MLVFFTTAIRRPLSLLWVKLSNKVKLFKSEMESTKYKINFINIDNQDNVALDIKIIKSS
jgi:hypothetical protein